MSVRVCVCVYGDIQALIVCGCAFQHTSTSFFHTEHDKCNGFAAKLHGVNESGCGGVQKSGYITLMIDFFYKFRGNG